MIGSGAKVRALIRYNTDCALSYRRAAQKVRNDNFRNFLKSYSTRRMAFADELSQHAAKLNYPDQGVPHAACRMMKKLLNIRDEPSEIKDKAILRACGKGEERVRSAYDEALSSTDLSAETKKILFRHRNYILVARRILFALKPIVVYQRHLSGRDSFN